MAERALQRFGYATARTLAGRDHLHSSLQCGKSRRKERALPFCEEIPRQGLQLDVITCTASISACGKSQRAERVSQLFGGVAITRAPGEWDHLHNGDQCRQKVPAGREGLTAL